MAIPAGLHVRINFQTRKREAKLLDKSQGTENNDNALTLKNNNEVHQNALETEKTLLSDALKNFQKGGKHLKYNAESLSQIKRDYRAAKKEFKDKFEKMHEHFKSDAEIITLLIEEFANLTKPEHKTFGTSNEQSKRQSQILDSFDYMLHQIDNSMLFVSQGGLNLLLPIVANETLPLRIKAMRVLGVMAQNNPKVQSEIFKQNFPHYILKTLISSSNTEELSTALFAFGSLLRKFPVAQTSLLSTSGMQALISVINRKCELKVKAKAVTIISDILEEYHHMISAQSVDDISDLDITKYQELKLYDWFKGNEFCDAVESVIDEEALQLFENPDIVENFIEAIENSSPVCRNAWIRSTKMKNSLEVIRNQYALSGDDYRTEVAQRISESLTTLQGNRHEEL